MGSFVTLDLQSLMKLLETCHNCLSGKPPQVTIEETLSKKLRNDVVRPFTFMCCGVIVKTEGAIFWHSDEITPDAITCGGDIENRAEFKLANGEEVELDQFEDIIVKCEDDTCRADVDTDEANGIKVLAEEDPLSLGETHDLPTNNSENVIYTKDSFKSQAESSQNLSNKELRKNLLGILSQQDTLVQNDTLEQSSKISGSSKHTKYPDTFTCEFCGKVFTGKERAYQFYYHRNKEHTHEMLYKCDICSKGFWGDRELLAHMAGHRDPGHICHICGQKFNAKRNLKAHLLIHQPLREHTCRFCDKSFRRKDHLQVHERIHTGERPYQCKWCESGYPQKRQLVLHQRKCPIQRRQNLRYVNPVT
ncbi:zinc finger protein 300-like [Penaeus indicus]|uniref:zinc finger protein 300-like n=1 Tax=Penaeus indicus TaxID=29960 RepID=UPI00300C352A